jgi:hypothetical protein
LRRVVNARSNCRTPACGAFVEENCIELQVIGKRYSEEKKYERASNCSPFPRRIAACMPLLPALVHPVRAPLRDHASGDAQPEYV